jgi:hypothetical protein
LTPFPNHIDDYLVDSHRSFQVPISPVIDNWPFDPS